MKDSADLLFNVVSLIKKPFMAALLGVTIIFSIHFVFPSYLNGMPKSFNFNIKSLWYSSLANDTYQLRISFSEFSKRPFTIGLQKIAYQLHIPYQFSFDVIGLLSLFFCCICLSRISVLLGGNENDSYLAIYAFIFSYSILFAFMRPMDTYDDPLQYLLILIAVLLHLKNKDEMAMAAFTLACIARETSFLLLPFFIVRNQPLARYRLLRRIMLWTLPVILYSTYFYLILDSSTRSETISFNAHHRLYGWTENFKTISTSIVSITNAVLILGLPCLVLSISFSQLSTENKSIIQLTTILTCVNVLISLVSGLANESRLFALPLLLIWPLLPQALPSSYTQLIHSISTNKGLTFIVFITSLAFSFLIFNPVGGKVGLLYKSYLALYLCIALILLNHLWQLRKVNKSQLVRPQVPNK